MKRMSGWLVCALCVLVVGCESVLGLVSSNQVTVLLVNESPSFRVDGTLVFADDDLPRALLDQLGTEFAFDLGPGETQRFSRDCDSVGSLRITDADLRVVAGISPGTSTSVQSEGDDYNCGDDLIFTFSHSAVFVDFDVTITTQPGVDLFAIP